MNSVRNRTLTLKANTFFHNPQSIGPFVVVQPPPPRIAHLNLHHAFPSAITASGQHDEPRSTHVDDRVRTLALKELFVDVIDIQQWTTRAY